MKPGAGAGAGAQEEDVQVLVERPYSHDGPHSPRPPPHHHQQLIRARPYYRRWSPWIVPGAAAACVALFLVTMYVNDCPKHNTNCAAAFLGRTAFQPLRENPLLGPSSATYVCFRFTCFSLSLLCSFLCFACGITKASKHYLDLIFLRTIINQ